METITKQRNFLLVSIQPQNLSDGDALNDLRELKSLVEAYGGVVCDLVVQRREVHDKGMYIGRGKLEEVSKLIVERKIDVVVLNAIARSGHLHEMKRSLEKVNTHIAVWDRVDLILEIFALHAHTAEAKMQIELASMRHMGPRIYGMGFIMSRQGGGIGTSGIGETNTELMKRHWRDQIKKVRDKIEKHSLERLRQLERRSRNGVKTVSLIGYTNAGKTSLFNLLTKKKNVVQDALFVTLDSSTGKVFLPESKREILVTDTIGFISNLPPSLIDAFRSTLMESIHADLLLLVIDASDEDRDRKIRVVERVLGELRLLSKPRIYIFNKIDKAADIDKEEIEGMYGDFNPQYVSVKTGQGLASLLTQIEDDLHSSVTLPYEPAKQKRVHL